MNDGDWFSTKEEVGTSVWTCSEFLEHLNVEYSSVVSMKPYKLLKNVELIDEM